MSAKYGSLLDRFNHQFQLTPITGAGTCMLRGEQIAVVPMRYALDRSSFDPEPDKLTPLLPYGQWASLPDLLTRQWTLRQLRSGYLYSFDETTGVFEEWYYDAVTADISQLASEARPRPYLLFPRDHHLRLAWSKWAWSPALRDEIRSSPASREHYMQELDLRLFCNRLVCEGALPLKDIANAVADVVEGEVPIDDERFRDSYFPPQVCDEDYVPLASQVLWTGGVPDQNNALFVALPDKLGAVAEMCHQLTADQAAVDEWRERHGHRYDMAQHVETLCGALEEKAWLPKRVVGYPLATRRYLQDAERYFEAWEADQANTIKSRDGMVTSSSQKSAGLVQHLIRTYGMVPPDAMRESWQERSKWRREVDLDEVHAFVDKQQLSIRLLEERRDNTAHDLTVTLGHIGLDPKAVFIDITEAASLTHLYDVIVPAVMLLAQDVQLHEMLVAQEEKTQSLLGLARYGFAYELKRVLEDESNALFASPGDANTATSRLGELASFLGHDALQQTGWMQKLNASTRLTLKHMVKGAKAGLTSHFEHLVSAFLPIDSKMGLPSTNMAAALRTLWISSVLIAAPPIAVDLQFDKRIEEWGQKVRGVRADLKRKLNAWHANRGADRVALGYQIHELRKLHQELMYRTPVLLDGKIASHLKIVRSQILEAARNGATTVAQWNDAVGDWLKKLGGLGGAIAWGVVGMNLFNTAYVYKEITRFSDWTEQDWKKLQAAVAYTGQALASIWVSYSWGHLKGLSHIIGGKPVLLFSRSGNFWARHSLRTAHWGRLINAFSTKMAILGGLGIVAINAELAEIRLELRHKKSEHEKELLESKFQILEDLRLVSYFQLSAGLLGIVGNPTLLRSVPSFLTLLASLALGVRYWRVSVALSNLKRDHIGAWLQAGSWSLSTESRQAMTTDYLSETTRLMEIYLMPAIYVKPILTGYLVSRGEMGLDTEYRQTGIFLQILLPPVLSTVRMKAAAVNLPLPNQPNEILHSNFESELVTKGTQVPAEKFGFPENTKVKQLVSNESGILWQSSLCSVPSAEVMELEIFYPTSLFGDPWVQQGYRFRIPLTATGHLEPGSKLLPSEVKRLVSDDYFSRRPGVHIQLEGNLA